MPKTININEQRLTANLTSFLGFVALADEARVLWTVRTLKRLADATGFDLSRHMDGATILGGEMKVGSMKQRAFVDRIMGGGSGRSWSGDDGSGGGE